MFYVLNKSDHLYVATWVLYARRCYGNILMFFISHRTAYSNIRLVICAVCMYLRFYTLMCVVV